MPGPCPPRSPQAPPPLWTFQSLGTIRQRLLHRAGFLTRPQGELTFQLNANQVVRDGEVHGLTAGRDSGAVPVAPGATDVCNTRVQSSQS